MKCRGRPPKASKKNLTGLRNQSQALASDSSCSASRNASPSSGALEGKLGDRVIVHGSGFQVCFDSLRVSWEDEEQGWESDVDEDIEDTEDIWEREELTPAIVKLIEVEDEHDGDWLPLHLRWAELRRTGESI